MWSDVQTEDIINIEIEIWWFETNRLQINNIDPTFRHFWSSSWSITIRYSNQRDN